MEGLGRSFILIHIDSTYSMLFLFNSGLRFVVVETFPSQLGSRETGTEYLHMRRKVSRS